MEHRARADCAGPGHLGGQEIDAFSEMLAHAILLWHLRRDEREKLVLRELLFSRVRWLT